MMTRHGVNQTDAAVAGSESTSSHPIFLSWKKETPKATTIFFLRVLCVTWAFFAVLVQESVGFRGNIPQFHNDGTTFTNRQKIEMVYSLGRGFTRFASLPRHRCSRTFHYTSPVMVEGHSVHRVAFSHTQRLVGKRFAASSPNGRFLEGAKAIDGKQFQRIEAVGKNLFAFFGEVDLATMVCVHVHFGMSGAWSVFDRRVEEVPEVSRSAIDHRIDSHGRSITASIRMCPTPSAFCMLSRRAIPTARVAGQGNIPERDAAAPRARGERARQHGDGDDPPARRPGLLRGEAAHPRTGCSPAREARALSKLRPGFSRPAGPRHTHTRAHTQGHTALRARHPYGTYAPTKRTRHGVSGPVLCGRAPVSGRARSVRAFGRAGVRAHLFVCVGA